MVHWSVLASTNARDVLINAVTSHGVNCSVQCTEVCYSSTANKTTMHKVQLHVCCTRMCYNGMCH